LKKSLHYFYILDDLKIFTIGVSGKKSEEGEALPAVLLVSNYTTATCDYRYI
jgi:hypothetical protein